MEELRLTLTLPLRASRLWSRRSVWLRCEHLFVSLSALHFAIRDKDAERALRIANDLRYVPLRYGLRLVLLLADEKHPSFEGEAREFIRQILGELPLPLIQSKKLIDALAHLDHYFLGYDARLALQDVVGQLHRRAGPIETGFDSLASNERRRT